MTLDDCISQLMTCASDPSCKKERACFEVARYALECRRKERLEHAIHRIEGVKDFEEELFYFTPPLHWESHLPPWRI